MNIFKAIKIWKTLGITLPLIGLLGLVIFSKLPFDHWYEILVNLIIFSAGVISIFWWWWALSQLANMAKITLRNEENFKTLKTQFQEIKKEIKNARNR